MSTTIISTKFFTITREKAGDLNDVITLEYEGHRYYEWVSLLRPYNTRFGPIVEYYCSETDFSQSNKKRFSPQEIVDLVNRFSKTNYLLFVKVDRTWFGAVTDEFDRYCSVYIPECLFNDFLNWLNQSN